MSSAQIAFWLERESLSLSWGDKIWSGKIIIYILFS